MNAALDLAAIAARLTAILLNEPNETKDCELAEAMELAANGGYSLFEGLEGNALAEAPRWYRVELLAYDMLSLASEANGEAQARRDRQTDRRRAQRPGGVVPVRARLACLLGDEVDSTVERVAARVAWLLDTKRTTPCPK